VPVVRVPGAGVVDAVESGTTGELVDPLSSEQMRRQSVTTFDNRSLRRKAWTRRAAQSARIFRP